jgi:hypothetical protein
LISQTRPKFTQQGLTGVIKYDTAEQGGLGLMTYLSITD